MDVSAPQLVYKTEEQQVALAREVMREILEAAGRAVGGLREYGHSDRRQWGYDVVPGGGAAGERRAQRYAGSAMSARLTSRRWARSWCEDAISKRATTLRNLR